MKNLLLSIIALSVLFATSCKKGDEPTPSNGGNGNGGTTVTDVSVILNLKTIKGYSGKSLKPVINGVIGTQFGLTASPISLNLKSDGSNSIDVVVKDFANVPETTEFSFNVFIRNDSLIIHSNGLQAGTDFTYSTTGLEANYKNKYPNIPYDVTFNTYSTGRGFAIEDKVTNPSNGTTNNTIVFAY